MPDHHELLVRTGECLHRRLRTLFVGPTGTIVRQLRSDDDVSPRAQALAT